MILYFSATGNEKYISEQIAERTNETCMSIVDCIREDKYSFYDPVMQAAWRRKKTTGACDRQYNLKKKR